MTDILHIIPDFPTKHYTHLFPSLEKHLITTSDLLTLDALEVAKRARLPLLDLRRLADHVLAILQDQLGLRYENVKGFEGVGGESVGFGSLNKTGKEVSEQWSFISTLDLRLDAILGDGIPTGYVTEITGESGAGKTQLLLTLLLSVQLHPPHGISRPALYISTEHPLPTTRLSQLLRTNQLLSTNPTPPNLNNILTLNTPDLESQEHILNYQLPVALSRHKIGLVVIDSIAANYRAERGSSNTPSALATQSTQLVRLGALLRRLAREHDCAIVVANQVADRFAPLSTVSRASAAGPNTLFSSSPASTASNFAPTPSVLSLDHQQRFFTGWGDDPSSAHVSSQQSANLKTPSLGLVWANQIACRIALIKEQDLGRHAAGEGGHLGTSGVEGVEWTSRRWRRWMKLVFAPWAAPSTGKGVEFEIEAGGITATTGVMSIKDDAGKALSTDS